MKGFQDVTIGWQDEEYTIPANQMLGLVCRIEDALAGDEGDQAFTVLMRRQGPPHGRLSKAYASALRYAGASVTDEEVYLSMQEDLSSGSAEAVSSMQQAIIALICVVSPPMGSVLLQGSQKKTKKSPKKA